MIADSNSMCIFSKIVNDRLGTIEGFLAVRDPFFFIAGVKKFFESIVVAIFYAAKISDIIFISSNGAGFQISKLANIFDFIHI